MIVTVFRSRLRPEAQQQYTEWAGRISALAKEMSGHVSHKVFIAEDGERVTIVEFESAKAQRDWSIQPQHLEAKSMGVRAFYSEYRLQVCSVLRQTTFAANEVPVTK